MATDSIIIQLVLFAASLSIPFGYQWWSEKVRGK